VSLAHIRRAIMEEHRASIEAYKKVHEETLRSGLRMAIVQQSMKIDMWEIKEKLAERQEQMDIRAYEEDKRREEWIQKIKEDKRPSFSLISHMSIFILCCTIAILSPDLTAMMVVSGGYWWHGWFAVVVVMAMFGGDGQGWCLRWWLEIVVVGGIGGKAAISGGGVGGGC
nr:hypothetical protein [Tanacetum cinerariifolium]